MREIYIVNAAQVVVSESHPEGIYSVVQGYPKTFDSRSFNATAENPDGDTDKALRMAKSDYYAQESLFYAADNRAKWAITLEMSNGRQIMRESFGAFPDMTPEPETPVEPEGGEE